MHALLAVGAHACALLAVRALALLHTYLGLPFRPFKTTTCTARGCGGGCLARSCRASWSSWPTSSQQLPPALSCCCGCCCGCGGGGVSCACRVAASGTRRGTHWFSLTSGQRAQLRGIDSGGVQLRGINSDEVQLLGIDSDEVGADSCRGGKGAVVQWAFAKHLAGCWGALLWRSSPGSCQRGPLACFAAHAACVRRPSAEVRPHRTSTTSEHQFEPRACLQRALTRPSCARAVGMRLVGRVA